MAVKKIKTPQELDYLIDKYIEAVEAGTYQYPTDYNLCKFLGVSPDTIERMRKGEDTYKGYAEPLKKLRLYREDFYLRRGDTMAVFALKQRQNGGYTDKPVEDKAPQKIEVVIKGAKDAFG